MIWILPVVLTVIGGAAAVGIAANDRKTLPAAPAPKALTAGQPSVREIRVGDVLMMDGRDYLVEGTVGYDEDGHRWIGGRVLDAGDVKWLVVGMERAGAGTTRLLVQDDATNI